MGALVEHRGVVVASENGRVDVEIEVQEACRSCKAKELCGAGGAGHRLISVYTQQAQAYETGESVVVQAAQSIGIKAAVYAYVIPFLLLLVCLIIMLGVGVDESVAGLCSLGAVLVYYLALVLLRGKFEKEIIFKLKKI